MGQYELIGLKRLCDNQLKHWRKSSDGRKMDAELETSQLKKEYQQSTEMPMSVVIDYVREIVQAQQSNQNLEDWVGNSDSNLNNVEQIFIKYECLNYNVFQYLGYIRQAIYAINRFDFDASYLNIDEEVCSSYLNISMEKLNELFYRDFDKFVVSMKDVLLELQQKYIQQFNQVESERSTNEK